MQGSGLSMDPILSIPRGDGPVQMDGPEHLEVPMGAKILITRILSLV